MKEDRNINQYDDIINLPHHVSKVRPHMSIHDRAAQFAPFAAMTGHDMAIKETGRLTDSRIELDEDAKILLNEKLKILSKDISREVSITYFVPDENKAGGKYLTLTGCVKKIDNYNNALVMEDATKIPINDIIELEEAEK